MKKSFIIHNDSLAVLDDLTDEQCGELFRAIKAYQLGEEITLSPIAKIAFSPFKNQFVRDGVKYDALCEKNRQIALARHATKSTTGTSGNQTLPVVTKSTDNDSDSKKDSDSEKNKRLDQSSIDHDVLDFCFDQFWSSGIRKVNKKKAKPLFGKVLNLYATEDGPTAYDFTTALSNDVKKRLESNQLGFAEMHPTTYLNGERWNDEVIPNGETNGQQGFIDKHRNPDWREGLTIPLENEQ